ncbi:MAG: UDP-N-acetylglucosamine--N-acetylmuramyl-(pentapeptide) pyrophosphoryl-undecaprenol N-acetylglucosamine transferase [Candidatus Caenarcaniphilales bacterium]|nr:UDP-N-acetylglucosamine--N-acetylmuramyl-(pentapeptide) pyrophosphoryl-undecaprenol N-acetylglucosamine transferase [Candidatus Caenarcaniphilales bacterium]
MKKDGVSPLIAFTGGGTGGHVYPIIAVYEKLRENLPQASFIYFGTKEKIEKKVANENQINFQEIPFTGGMPRSIMVFPWLAKFIFTFLKTFFVVFKHRPKIIFGTGGYIAAPVFLSAILLKIPYIIHNLDAHMGLANKLFIKNSKALTLGISLTSFNEKTIPKNGPVIVTGNPVRRSFYEKKHDKDEILRKLELDPKRKTLIVIGGSQGAKFINELFFTLIEDLINENWQIIHQLGPLQFDRFKNQYKDYVFYKPMSFIENLNEIYSIADVAISRSGAMSIAELSAKNVPAVYIPLPTAAQNHQFFNALSMEESGCSIVLEQKNATKTSLKERIDFIYSRKDLYSFNMKNSKHTANSSITISNIIKTVLK